MNIEMILSKDEVAALLEQYRDDAPIEFSQVPEGNLLVSFTSVSISKTEFAEMVMQDFGMESDKVPVEISVEDMKLMPNGSVGLILLKKVKL